MDKITFGGDFFTIPVVTSKPKTMIEVLEEALAPDKTTPTILNRASFIYELRDIIKEHGLTLEQAIYLLASLHDIDWELTGADALSLISKGLIKDNKVNQTVLFRTRPAIQGTLDFNSESVPKGDEETLRLAHNLEAKFVPSAHLTEDYRKKIADEFFKGDKSVARYFIIFRHLFPVRDLKANSTWNKHFGFSYNGISLWDSHVRVAKKFHEIYRKKDIGLFLSGAYHCVRDSIDLDSERCFMTKPYKFLLAFEPWYETARERMDEAKTKQAHLAAVIESNNTNKTQSL
jgi:hypothetical protein